MTDIVERIWRTRKIREAVRDERGWVGSRIERPQFRHEPTVACNIDVVLQASR